MSAISSEGGGGGFLGRVIYSLVHWVKLYVCAVITVSEWPLNSGIAPEREKIATVFLKFQNFKFEKF